jgi:hypothetical protein
VKNYLDKRTITLKEFKGPFETELISVTLFEIPIVPVKTDLDEIITDVQKIIHSNKLDLYSLEDKRSYFEHGASMSGQEVIVSILGGLGANAASSVIQNIWEYAKIKIYKKSSAEIDEQTEQLLEYSKALIKKHFSPSTEVKIVSVSKKVTETVVLLSDSESNTYKTRLFPDGKIIEIKKTNNT